MGFNNKIYLVDIDTVLNTETGKNTLQIVKETKVFADRQEVGLQEYYSAVGNSTQLIATFEIPAHMYNGEKYIISGDRKIQYEISRAAKGHTEAYIRLPVRAVKRGSLLEGFISG